MNHQRSESFDPVQWYRDTRPNAPTEGYDFLQGIHGPLDAYSVLKLRDATAELVDSGQCVPTDVFLLSTGEPQDRTVTKIGGLPYWKKDRPWPKGPAGEPLPFLAQFDFRDSRDIVRGAAGDILLIFAYETPSRGCVAVWESVSAVEGLVSPADVPRRPEVPSLFGTRWRTEQFPEWKGIDEDLQSGTVELTNGRIIEDLYFVYELLGMQISTYAFMPPGGQIVPDGNELICSLSGIAIPEGRPYPFLNEPFPFDTDTAAKWLVPLSDYRDADGFGVLLVTRNKSGDLQCIHLNL